MRRETLICAALLVITLTGFWPAGRLGFINYDDCGSEGYIVDNTNIQTGITFESVRWAFTTTHAANWHPVTWLSHMLDYKLFGLNAGGHHWMNLGFHIANTLLLFLVLNRMTGLRRNEMAPAPAQPGSPTPAGAMWRSALVAALFGLHPLHIQSVAWVSERKDLLSGFFMMLTLWAWVRYVQKQASGVWRLASGDYWLALVFFALGLMSKPMLVTLPVILLLLDFWPLGRSVKCEVGSADSKSVLQPRKGAWPRGAVLRGFTPLLLEKLPFFVLSLASCVVTVWAQGTSVVPLDYVPWDWRIENSLASYTFYLGKLFWPENLAIFYPYIRIQPWEVFESGLLLILLSVFCIRRMRLQPWLLAGWLWFLVMLLPVIGLVQVSVQAMADRYMYLPSIGLFIMVAWGLGGIASLSRFWRTAVTLGATALLLACLLVARHQLSYWQNSVTLFSRALEVTGENPMGDYFLANAYQAAGNLDEAAWNYRLVLRRSPDSEDVHYRLGRIFLLQKKWPEAGDQFNEVLRLDPNNPFVRKFLGDALSAQEKFTDAEAEYSTASQLNPGDPVIEQALEKNRYLETLHLKPDSPEVLNNLAWMLATSTNADMRDGAHAVQLAERACELTHHQKTIYLGTLAAAYAEAGRFDDAMVAAQKAIALAQQNGERDLLQKNQELLERYRRHQTARE